MNNWGRAHEVGAEPRRARAIGSAHTSSSDASSARSMMNRKRRRGVLAHQLVDDAVGLSCVVDRRPAAARRVLGSSVVSFSTFGIISPRPLKRVISGLALPGSLAPRIASRLRVVERPVASPCRCRCGRAAAGRGRRGRCVDQLRQVPVEEREQQRRDVVAVASRRPSAGRSCRSAAASRSKSSPMPQPSARDDVCELLVLEHLGQVEACSALSTLPRSGRIAWRVAVAALLGRAACRVALDDEQLALAGSVDEQSASLPGRLSRCADGASCA